MRTLRPPMLRCAGLLFVAVALACAQDWKTASSLPGVDFSGLNPKAKLRVLKILRERPCSCGCGDTLAQCRVVDPGCAYSTNLAIVAVNGVKNGQSDAEVIAALGTSKWAHLQGQQPQQLLDPPVKIPISGSPAEGSPTAKVTIVEFSDFQCPYCAAAIVDVNKLLKAYPTQIRLIFKQFPLEMHPQANYAAAAALAAQRQGKFWQLHDAMFAHQEDLSRQAILEYARATGLNMQQFETDIDSTEVRETVIRDVQDGNTAGVEGTPTFFINGQHYNGSLALERLKPVIDNELSSGTTTASR